MANKQSLKQWLSTSGQSRQPGQCLVGVFTKFHAKDITQAKADLTKREQQI